MIHVHHGPLGRSAPVILTLGPGPMGSRQPQYCQLLWQRRVVSYTLSPQLPPRITPVTSVPISSARASHMVTPDLEGQGSMITFEK